MELSLHVDRITCHADGRVEMRMCKLGALPEVVDLLCDVAYSSNSQLATSSDQLVSGDRRRRRGPRRRGRLRTTDLDAASGEDPREVADFAADTHRFDNLPDQFFWVDEFRIPTKISWVEQNAEGVLRRRDEIEKETGKRPSQNVLAREFGVSRPTINTALEIATGKRQRRKDRPPAKRNFRSPLDDAARQKIIRLHLEGRLTKEEIGDHCGGVHRSTVDRVLNAYYAERGEKRPDGRKRRRGDPPAESAD
jgi:hypothetical protein